MRIRSFVLASVAFLGITGSANAATALLQTNDFVEFHSGLYQWE